jgi:hypothetical protein
MAMPASTRRMALGLLAALSVLLAGCLLTPGKFSSELSVRRDGTFAYSYRGDIVLLGLTQLADKTTDATLGEFTPSACHDEKTFAERKCTDADLAQQKSEWDAGKEAAKKKRQDDAEMMKTMLGGIDPSDPRAAEEFAARLRRQVGWRSVVSKGKGVFEVDFAITGRIDHDFLFPTIERMPVITPFVTIVRRTDGTVRIDAPAFTQNAGGSNPMLGMMSGMSEAQAEREKSGVPALDGTFALVTDGDVLANNTDEGAVAVPGGKRLAWKVDVRTTAPPSALIKLR